jgi:hypothetical protein
MDKPLVVNLPHNLGVEEARRRLQGGMGKLQDHIPGGATVQSGWQEDRMNLAVKAMGQEIAAKIDIKENLVTVEMLLPPMLAFFGRQIEHYLHNKGGQLLEDQSKKN